MAALIPLAAILSTVATVTTTAISTRQKTKEASRARSEQQLATAEALRREQLGVDRADRLRRRRSAGSGQTLLGGIETPVELGRNTLLGL